MIIIATIAAFVTGLTIGAGVVAMLNYASTIDPVLLVPPDREFDGTPRLQGAELIAQHERTIDDLRTQLETCRSAYLRQQERADTYYDLYCVGAKANAALRNGKKHA